MYKAGGEERARVCGKKCLEKKSNVNDGKEHSGALNY